MKITQEYNLCIGCGTCVALCSKFREFDGDEGKARPIGSKKEGDNYVLENDNTKEEDLKCSKEAAEACPVQIIRLEP